MDISQLKIKLGEKFKGIEEADKIDLSGFIVPADQLHEIIVFLKEYEEGKFNYLFNLTCTDNGDSFTMLYYMESVEERANVVVKTNIDREKPVIPTVADLFPAAEYLEREVYDLFGVVFENHPDLRRLFLEDDFGYPLRKDFKDEINIIER